jgi:hypothetical protein
MNIIDLRKKSLKLSPEKILSQFSSYGHHTHKTELNYHKNVMGKDSDIVHEHH